LEKHQEFGVSNDLKVSYKQPLSGFTLWMMKLVTKENLINPQDFVPKEVSHVVLVLLEDYLPIIIYDNKEVIQQ